ncbi:MAG: hypothetical protein KKH08_07400 [Candidatus Omnitrophica bacterium]|nr:hypothetical protein [Candidatus Omnitrophota bacterium]
MRKPFYVVIIAALFIFFTCPSFAAESSIESLNKIRTAKGYIFKINYQTAAEWADGIVFKIFCTFSKDVELSFTSSGNNNIKKGWHKTEIHVPKVYRDRYGYIKDYRVEMYQKGMLIAIKSL